MPGQLGSRPEQLGGPGLTLFLVSLIARCLEREEDMLAAELGQRYEHYRQQAHWRRIPRVF